MGPTEKAYLEAWTRRKLMRRAAQLGAIAAVPAFISACGSSDGGSTSTTATGSANSDTGGPAPADQIKGTITLRTYPGWIGDKEISTFEKRYPGTKVKEQADTSSGAAETAALLKRNEGSFDLTLAGLVTAGQLEAAGVLEPFDTSAVPNLKNIPAVVREAFPVGVPGDMGKTGFAYRKDLVSEKPTSWADFWELATGKYSGKVTTFAYDVDILGAALLYKGYSVNSTDEAEINGAKDALIELKPHLRAILDTDFSKPLKQGTAALAIDYDYDIAAAQADNPDIEWVTPTEGVPAYLEGWVPIKGSKNLPTTYAFMDQHLEPEIYANYINTIGAAYLMPAAEQWIKPEIKNNPSLKFDEAVISSVGFEEFLGPDATVLRTKAWQEFMNA